MFPCVDEAERELDVDDEFEDDEVGVGHEGIITCLGDNPISIELQKADAFIISEFEDLQHGKALFVR